MLLVVTEPTLEMKLDSMTATSWELTRLTLYKS